MRIIVLNCFSRNSLAIIKALHPSIEIIGGAVYRQDYLLIRPDKYFRHRRVKEIFRHRDPKISGEGFLEDIIAACRKYDAQAVMASGTSITNYLSFYKEKIEETTAATALVEPFNKLERLTDKWHTYELACKEKVRVPRTVLLDGREDMEDHLADLGFPLVLKPRRSYAAIGVRFIRNKSELDKFLAEDQGATDGSIIAQEKIDGELHDVTGCAQNGRVLSLLSQRRLKTLYDFGGGGIVNITTDDTEPKEYARRLMAAMQWNGAVEFDFMKDKEGRFYLIECNPKIWGTTYLTVAAGMNVPQQTVDVFTSDAPVQPVSGYEVGLLYRWLFPECVFSWLQKPRTPSLIYRRLRQTFQRAGASRIMNNLEWSDLRHLLGIIFDRAQL